MFCNIKAHAHSPGQAMQVITGKAERSMDLSTLGTNLLIKYFKRDGSQKLLQTTWLWNHTCHTKVYVNEFVANVLLDNMGMIIFDLWGCGG